MKIQKKRKVFLLFFNPSTNLVLKILFYIYNKITLNFEEIKLINQFYSFINVILINKIRE